MKTFIIIACIVFAIFIGVLTISILIVGKRGDVE
jgi:hypothetical protein